MTTPVRERRAQRRPSAARRRGDRADELASPFLAEVPASIRDHLAASLELRDFLATAGALTLAERKLLVDQALVLFQQNYVHLPLKVAMHAVNPVQRLQLLRARLERQTSATMDPEWAFHAEMAEIFHSVRDLHTNYMLPDPFRGKVAYIPFLVEEYFQAGKPRFIVTHVVSGFSEPGFEPGVEVVHWSGIPIGRAVDIHAARFAGSNAAARRARGVESLTIRPLRSHLPPDEEWVTVSYVGLDGTSRELRQKWLVAENLPSFIGNVNEVTTTATSLGLDIDLDDSNRAKKMLFAPHVVAAESRAADGVAVPTAPDGADVPTNMPGIFRARSVTTPSGTFGHIRIYTFSVDNPDAFVAEFVRLIELLPPNGLIVDVRGNGGGHIYASEFLLQTLCPRRIEPEPVQFINTPLNLRIVRKHKDNPSGQIDLGPWFPSMDQALETGSTFSNAAPITPTAGANAIGQRYYGPVVLITNALCYSATDIFAAGFRDHKVGKILGVHDNTGAGGANVWTHDLLRTLLAMAPADSGSPYKALPKNANMRVSIRRTLRVGAAAGTPVEDLGITPDERYFLTRADVLDGNVDLMKRAGTILAGMPMRSLNVAVTPGAGGSLAILVHASNIARVDVYVDGRPRASADIVGGSATVNLTGVPGAQRVRVEGYAGGELVAAKQVAV